MSHHHDHSCCGGHGHHHHGKGAALAHWVKLRLSALLLLPLVAWIIFSIISLRDADYITFTSWIASPVNAALLALFTLASCYHAALGVQEIIEDYISCEKSAKCAIAAEKIAFVFVAAASLLSIGALAF